MTRQQYIDEILKTYDIVSTLSNKNGCITLRLRHKTLKRDIVLHSLNDKIELYSLLCGVKCENLPEIYDSILLDDGQIVLEEFIVGNTVADIMYGKKYDKKSVKHTVRCLCSALNILHKFGFVHRDIKPENVVIGKNGRVVLIDFNAARSIKLAEKDTVIMGTVGYAAPEQLGITQSDTRTDIYSLGILLNVMLTGNHPCNKMVRGKLGRIVKKCTSLNPNDRYQTVISLRSEL